MLLFNIVFFNGLKLSKMDKIYSGGGGGVEKKKKNKGPGGGGGGAKE